MSFLNNVLSSISGAPIQAPPSRPTSTNPSSASRAPVPHGEGPNHGAQSAVPVKRKAEGDQDLLRSKVAKKDADAATAKSAVARPSATAPPGKQQSSTTTVPYRGTAQPAGTIRRTAPQRPTVGTASQPATQKQTAKPVTPTSATTPAPKKGSFQEIMARAAAAQAAAKPVGLITHKPTEKLPKKGQQAQAGDTKSKAPVGRDRPIASKGGSRTPEPATAKGKPSQPTKEKKKPVELGYTGTIRAAPKEPMYSGTMRSGSAKPAERGRFDRSRSTSLAAKPKGRFDRYARSEEEEEEEEEEDDYNSEGSSDMEAGAFDLDQEEQLSLKAARREDEEALKEEEALKRRKLERKNMLAKMAANAKNKKRF
ncbi:hypothetical protein K490DRAFT_67463 [Saccharata proteae CBS 121410]|uniref:SPT2-domain-containing protein n=1 Tax=Saccharata proteae CBS 121410 TaxID=1314787 RepID=A0A9P4HT79_9PEZI|nr:hypothetical protein K490DRAFT_67463 [Saccharata proteae CBS 121410]